SNFTAQAATAGSNNYGSFTLLADGHWSYTADNSQTAIQQISEEHTLALNSPSELGYGTPSQKVTVTIHGTNDTPVIGGVSTGNVTHAVSFVSTHISPSSPLSPYTTLFRSSNFTAQAATAGSNNYGSFTLLADGHWSYTADNSQTAIQQ